MPHTVSLYINEYKFSVGLDSNNNHTIREDDSIFFEIFINDEKIEASIFFEDAEADLLLTAESSGFVYKIPPSRYFSECFGQAYVRIYVEGTTYTIFFNVRAKKVSVIAAAKMISYLASHHESIIRSCFSRSAISVGSSEGPNADPEAIIAAAESYTSALMAHMTELLATKKTRLAPARQPLWKETKSNLEIDPIDILSNLDAISPSQNEGELFLRGRYFSIGDIDISALKETANVLENKILLGGLYSIRNKIYNLLDKLDHRVLSLQPSDGYESLDRFLLTLTSAGMVKRCNEIVNRTNELTRLFESRIGVKYSGDIRPIMTPYARTSKIYRVLYSNLAAWYELGEPSLGANYFLMKLKSLSKIYELYALFHLIEQMLSTGWEGVQIYTHAEFWEFIPKKIKLRREKVLATIFYEPIINSLNSKKIDHLDLVDVAHRRPNINFNYWNPDYVIRLDSDNGNTRYIIADAKYSTENTVQKIHLPSIIDKYYWGMSVYNSNKKSYSNDLIAAVLVIYPPGASTSFLRYGRRSSIGNNPIPLPIIGAAGLTIESTENFNGVISEILENIHLALK